jgi:hypothetical protein
LISCSGRHEAVAPGLIAAFDAGDLKRHHLPSKRATNQWMGRAKRKLYEPQRMDLGKGQLATSLGNISFKISMAGRPGMVLGS